MRGSVIAALLCAGAVATFAGSARAATTSVPSIRLFGGSPGTFALCPAPAAAPNCDIASASVPAATTTGAIATLARRPGVDRIVLFLAGYSTSYPHGRQTAQAIQDEFGSRLLVVYVDWGSRGAHVDYEADARSARRNTASLAALVTALHTALPDLPLTIFAHSMGARLAAGAMDIVAIPPDGTPVVSEAVLAAPDLAIDDYRKAITRKPTPFGRVTIYASRHDRALLLSSIVHFHRRLGQSLPGNMLLANTEIVDASAADRAGEGHGYAIHDSRVVADIAQTLLGAPVPHASWNCAIENLCVLDPSKVTRAATPSGN